MSAATYEATLVSKDLIAKNTYEMSFSLSADFYFVPGQYLWLCVPALAFDDPRGNQRAFSIASSPQEKRMIRVCFRASGSGYKKTLLSLSIGSSIVISGPFGGNFCLSENVHRSVFVAGGTGISPFLSILRDENTWKNGASITLVYINSTKEKALYREEIALLSSQQKQFKLHERYGQVSDSSFPTVQFHADTLWYVSGPFGFVDAVYTTLEKRNIPDSAMHFEENYPRHFMALKRSTNLELFSTHPLSQMAQLLLDETTNHITFTNIDGRILYANAAAQRLTGYAFEEMRGNTSRLWGALMGREFYERLWRTIKIERKPFIDKITNRKKSGVPYIVLVRISPIIDRVGNLIGFIGTEEDITELERVSQAKTDFVSIASHQLRTPLSIMRWYAELYWGAMWESQAKNNANAWMKSSMARAACQISSMLCSRYRALNWAHLQLSRKTPMY